MHLGYRSRVIDEPLSTLGAITRCRWRIGSSRGVEFLRWFALCNPWCFRPTCFIYSPNTRGIMLAIYRCLMFSFYGQCVQEDKVYVIGGLVDRRPQKKRSARRLVGTMVPWFRVVGTMVLGVAGAALKQRHKVLPSVFDSSTGSTMTVLSWSTVRSISHERSEAIEGDGVQLKKLPLKQFAPKGGVTNVGVLGITQMAGSMEIDGGETKRFGMSPIHVMATYHNMSDALSCNTNRYQDDVLHTFVHSTCFRYISCCER